MARITLYMISAWMKRKSREHAKNWNCPELANNGNVFIVNSKESGNETE